MKFTLLSVLVVVAAGLSAIGVAHPSWAEPSQGSATDLLIPEEETTESFEYDTDELDQLSTQINHSTGVNNDPPVQIIQTSQDLSTSDGVLIFNNGSVTGGQKIPQR